MNMSGSMQAMKWEAMDWVVLIALLFTLLFLFAWALSPKLRTWIEKPKYRFLANVENHDQAVRAERTE
ncbi:MAG TPA: hypothetical protein VHZ74_17260 [Bryobacteraceae bacterium]|jgi:hypothetical protein|nr:hypothetical protein [Bryobacteraceae bacterium]